MRRAEFLGAVLAMMVAPALVVADTPDFHYEEEYIPQLSAWACRVYTADRKHCMAFTTTPTRGVEETRRLSEMVLRHAVKTFYSKDS